MFTTGSASRTPSIRYRVRAYYTPNATKTKATRRQLPRYTETRRGAKTQGWLAISEWCRQLSLCASRRARAPESRRVSGRADIIWSARCCWHLPCLACASCEITERLFTDAHATIFAGAMIWWRWWWFIEYCALRAVAFSAWRALEF